MGIDGLHPAIKPYLAQAHVRQLAGHRVGIDASGWLHRGAISAAAQLASGTRPYPWEQRGWDAPWVTFCLKLIAVLQSTGVTPVLVFDGRRLPAKAATNAGRRQRRQEARQRAERLMQEGRDSEAQRVLIQCVHSTPEMAHDLMLRLREQRVQFVVAPYEADAQLAYLASIPEHEGGVAAVVTEDSDLVSYGCRQILFKMDANGHCWELAMDRLFAGQEGAAAAAAAAATAAAGAGSGGGGSGSGSGGTPKVMSFRGWTLDMLQATCVLAGSDFLPSLKGISFKTAAGFVARRRSLEGALQSIKLEKRWQLACTPAYCNAAQKALLAFKHALVFGPNTAGGSVRRLTPVPPPAAAGQEEAADLAHLGEEMEPELARGIAFGHIHPHTLEPYPAAPPPGTTLPQQAAQQSSQPLLAAQPPSQLQRPMQLQPSISGRRQLGSWVAAGKARQQQQQHGLGPSQPLPPPMLQRLQKQWEGVAPRPSGQGQQASTDVPDVPQLFQLAPEPQQQQQQAGRTGWLQPTHAGEQQRTANMIARQQQQQSAQQPAQEQVAHAQQVRQAQQALPPQQSKTATCGESSMQETVTNVQPSQGSVHPLGQLAGGAQPLQPITNQVRQQQAEACASSSCATIAPSQAQVWDRAEQYRPTQSSQHQQRQQRQQGRGTPPAAAAGSKRKSSGGSSGGSAKKACKPLAPPAQRISRFFAPKPKQQ